MSDLASWIASGATTLAAVMTAANLGTRITGWGFVMFALASLVWAWVGITGDQIGLAVTNGVLLLINLFGAWRWLGRQARHEHGSAVATHRSRKHRAVPTLFSGAALSDARVIGPDGETVGTIVDTMFSSDDHRLNYVVIGHGGLAGVGETLRAVASKHFRFVDDTARCTLTAAEVAAIEPIDKSAWPAKAPDAAPQKSTAS